ncbi:pyrrolidone-carboxylate peptidase [Massilia sp. Root133]|uniref:pyroglutamyl-peptidase I n=1 Tax=unclassified Massilia TaxID=2609279 RepID=UPI0007018881|nr:MULTISPECIES: pyroglutamyl-peptidase I [unclassified Massilia]KQY18885.1 pyrrolidone-carboxylate peptidase [Massilia sp. Root133]KQZ53562.1 pyrrolidone-carboxylate peptidase [Massilia sp. Root1485]
MTAPTTQVPTRTVLLTGFEPFNGATINPSWEAVRALDGWSGPGFAVVARQLPCVFGTALDVLRESIAGVKPDIVIAVGQAGGRSEMSLERVAINVDDASIRDNAGNQPLDTPIAADGPAAYFTTLPVKAIVKALRLRGFPSGVSQTAGTFVCNHVFYGLMHHAVGQPVKAGFIHVPFLPEQAADRPERPPSMALRDIVDALRIAVEVAVVTETDTHEAGGATH